VWSTVLSILSLIDYKSKKFMWIFPHPLLNNVQQLENLKSKWLSIDLDEGFILHFLEHHSYFHFMQYFFPFWERKDWKMQFKSWVNFSAIYESYIFDYELRILLFSQIILIENSFKNIFCQESCILYGNTWWTGSIYYKDEKVYANIVLPYIQDIHNGNSKHDAIDLYTKKYTDPKYPPFWNMLEVFTFWHVTKIYKIFSDSRVKKVVSKKYGLHDEKFANWMKILVDIRNVCCHHNKLIWVNFKIADVDKIEWRLSWSKEWLHHACTIVDYLLGYCHPNNNFRNLLRELINKYPKVNHGILSNFEELWSK